MSDWSWRDSSSRAELLQLKRRQRVTRRARRLLSAYTQLQKEATMLALLKAQRLTAEKHKAMEAMAHVAAWCKDNT